MSHKNVSRERRRDDMTLHELLETVVQRGLLTPARIPPMRTAVKQYAAILGVAAAHCPPDLYHLPPKALTTLINRQAPATLGPAALRNVKNNLRWLLRQGETLHLISPLEMPLQSWQEVRRVGKHWVPNRGEQPRRQPTYRLSPLPPGLAAEFEAFSAWSTALYRPDRPARVHKRPVTLLRYGKAVSAIAGFAHRVEGMPLETLTLQTVTEPALVRRFTAWWIARRGKVTHTIHMMLRDLQTLAHYWLKDESRAKTLHAIKENLPPAETVHQKEARWVSLAALEAAGLSQYPLNARRLQDSQRMAKLARRLTRQPSPLTPRSDNYRRIASRVSQCLMLRFLVRIPLRQRNLREMQLDRHLRRLPNGTWELTFTGHDLKVGWRHGREHHVTYPFPQDLQPLLEEWLTIWRPLLLNDADVRHVFLTMNGQPHSEWSCRYAILTTTWKFAGVAVNPHMIRDIYATEYIKATRDVAGAAYMLGNTVQIVMKHYAHLLDADAGQRATQWLHAKLHPDA
jgi:hypothetical protein